MPKMNKVLLGPIGPKIGAHVSAAKSIDLSLDRGAEIGAECIQIFISPPQQWSQTKHSQETIEKFKQKQREYNIGSNFIHGTYLVNLGTEDQVHLKKSIEWLSFALNLASELEIKGVIFHTGSHKGVGFEKVLSQVTISIKEILKNSPKEVFLILETAAGSGNVIGDKFFELGKILKQVQDDRLKVCLDTQHVFAAGYELITKEGINKTLNEFDKEIGLENLVVIHANDSKFELGSNKDRHENIGEGDIGKEGFQNLLNHPKLRDKPFILEVPGFEGSGPDAKNINILKSLIYPN